jgi:Peptidase family M28
MSRPDMIELLGSGIGSRMAGSPESARAADAVQAAMDAVGLDVRLQEFEFVGYAPGEPALEINGSSWDAGPCLYARAAVAEGPVRFIGVFDDGVADFPVFTIEDQDTGELARLFAAPFDAGAVPLGSVFGPTLTGVAAVISSADGRRLREMDCPHARLETRGVLVEGLRERNVLGYLPGETPEWVVVSSHFDSVWRGSGVLDNATGVEGMLRVVERLSGSSRQRGVLACAFACEEIGLLGSRFFVTDQKIRGELDRIVGVVNLDAIAHGDFLEVSVAPQDLEERVLACAHQFGLTGRYPVVVRAPLPDADDYYFAQEGIPTVSFVHFPYREYHSTAELPALVDRRRLEDTVELAAHVARTQLELPVPRTPPQPIRQRLVPE